MRHILSNDEKNYIIENYYLATSTGLAKEIGCSRSAVLKVWMENNLSGKGMGRTYYCDFDYFENINTSNKAYILGLISSDGCLFKRDSHQGMWQLSLQERDINILQKISSEIKSDKPILTRKVDNLKRFNVCSLSINSDKMYSDLINFGLTDNKSYTININKLKVPNKHMSSFLRGYFDGDGSINKQSRGYGTPNSFGIGISGFIHNLESIKFILSDYKIQSTIILDNRRNNNFGYLSFKNTTEKYSFLRFIYEDVENYDSIYLDRKYLLYKEFKNIVENNVSNRSENKKAIDYYKSISN